jgi:predicted O-methyltransferase YrrM
MSKAIDVRALKEQLKDFSSHYHESGYILYELVLSNSLLHCLDVGLRKGLVTAYMAHALSVLAAGEVTALTLESQKDQATKVLSLLECQGIAQYVKVSRHSKSLLIPFLRLILNAKREYFNLIHIHSGCSAETTLMTLCIAEKSLAAGGWIALDNRRHKRKGTQSSERGGRDNDADLGAQIFEEFVGYNPAFDRFERQANLLLAQKCGGLNSSIIRAARRMELLTQESAARAADDLIFRLMLEYDSHSILSQLNTTLKPTEPILGCGPSFPLPETIWEMRGRLKSEMAHLGPPLSSHNEESNAGVVL